MERREGGKGEPAPSNPPMGLLWDHHCAFLLRRY